MKKPVNSNYAATVVELKDFIELQNCDAVKGALIFGNQVIVSKDAKAGQSTRRSSSPSNTPRSMSRLETASHSIRTRTPSHSDPWFASCSVRHFGVTFEYPRF